MTQAANAPSVDLDLELDRFGLAVPTNDIVGRRVSGESRTTWNVGELEPQDLSSRQRVGPDAAARSVVEVGDRLGTYPLLPPSGNATPARTTPLTGTTSFPAHLDHFGSLQILDEIEDRLRRGRQGVSAQRDSTESSLQVRLLSQ